MLVEAVRTAVARSPLPAPVDWLVGAALVLGLLVFVVKLARKGLVEVARLVISGRILRMVLRDRTLLRLPAPDEQAAKPRSDRSGRFGLRRRR